MKILFIQINRKDFKVKRTSFGFFLNFAILFSLVFSPLSPLFIYNAEAAFNKQINYQGKLTTSANIAVANGTYNMEFKLYDSTPSVIWTETRTNANRVQVTNGLFSVMLGEVNALTSVDFNQALTLSVNIGGTAVSPSWDGEMSPRKKLGAVPAAVESERVGGFTPSQTPTLNNIPVLSAGALTVTGSINSPTFDASSAVAMNLGIATQTALTIGRVGANTTLNGAVVNINSNATSALNITSGTTGALTLDSGTTGTINIGTGTLGKTINIGTNNTTADTIIIGSALDTIRIAKFTTDGFLKTNSANGTLSVDTNTYLTTTSAGTTYVPYTGATSNVNLGTYTLTTPTVLGGSTTTSPLTFQTTSAAGTTGADMHFKVGSNGGTEAITNLNSGFVGIGYTSPSERLDVNGNIKINNATDRLILGNTFTIQSAATAGASWRRGFIGSNLYWNESAGNWQSYNAGGGDVAGISFDNGGMSIIARDGYTQPRTFTTAEVSAMANMTFLTNGNVGIGTTSPTAQLSQKSTTATESATVGSEITNSTGWTTTGWTGSYNSFTHTIGNTTPLSRTMVTSNGQKYQVSWTVTGRTAGSFQLTLGGVTSIYPGPFTGTSAYGPTATGNGNLIFTPTTDFDGTISNISVKLITGTYTPSYTLQDNTGASVFGINSSLASQNNILIGDPVRMTTGTSNILLGRNSLTNNTSGYGNIAIGSGNLDAVTVGVNHIAIGLNNLTSVKNESADIAIGNSVLQSATGGSNIGMGYWTMRLLTTGAYNTSIGTYSGTDMTTGSYNTIYGYSTGRYLADGTTANQTPNNATYLGAYTRSGAANTTNEIVIGYNAIGNGSNTTTIGSSSTLRTYLAGLNLKAGTATAGTAPLKFTSGTLLTTTEAGSIEFLNDAYYGTITTGAGTAGARKQFAFTSDLTGGYVPYTGATGNVNLGANTLIANVVNIGIAGRLSAPAWDSGTLAIIGGSNNSGGITLQTTVGAVNQDRLTILNNGNVGIGTIAPSRKFEIVSSDAEIMLMRGTSYGNGLLLQDYTAGASLIGYDGSAYNAIELRATTGAGSQLNLATSGNVGIGTTDPVGKLEISSASDWLYVTDTTAMAAGVGGKIRFKGFQGLGGSPANFAEISGIKENSGENSAQGSLVFMTNNDSAGRKNENNFWGKCGY